MSDRAEPASSRPRLSREWSLAGIEAVVVENRHLRAVVLPVLGGKIVSLVDKRADVELLWRNDRVPLRPVGFGAGYDDNFVGGWDEVFPNDEPEVLAGGRMPDHGELWTLPWTVVDWGEDDAAWIELAVRTTITATSVTKRVVLGEGNSLRVEHTVGNESRFDLPFLWKSHVAVALRPDTTVSMAATEVLVHEFGAPRVRPPGGRFDWPRAEADGRTYDFRELPDTTERGISEFLIATGLTRGRCAVGHPAADSGLRLDWDRAELPSCWLFGSYGAGWRGLDVLVLEPCTGHPLSVVGGVAAGTHQVLAAGQTRTWSLTATVGPV